MSNKSCVSCARLEKCDRDYARRCRVWGGSYEDEVVDLLLWEPKEGEA